MLSWLTVYTTRKYPVVNRELLLGVCVGLLGIKFSQSLENYSYVHHARLADTL